MRRYRTAARFSLIVLTAPALIHCGSSSAVDDAALESRSASLRRCSAGEDCEIGQPLPTKPPKQPPCSIKDPDCAPPEGSDCKGGTGSLSAFPPSIRQGESTTLAWSVNLPPDCTGQVSLSSRPVALNGSMTVTPLANQAYHLRIGNETLATYTVPVTLPGTVRIKGNTAEWRALLLQALRTPNTRVVLADNVDMDMTGFEAIPIVQGVTLTSEAELVVDKAPMMFFAPQLGGLLPERPPSRNAHKLGPRLFTTSRPKPLFIIRCNNVNIFGDNVKLSGFRLQGPHWGTEEGDDNLERGIMVDSCINVDISTMELSGWSGQAIYVVDSMVRQFNPDAVKIHDNFIHHNQHEGGNGYGVDVAVNGYAAIERNVFDFNRHAIAASGKPGTGYRAHQNLVLRGGGVHGKWYNTYTHQFDVHGDANCPDIPGNQHTWNCGNAGDQFWLTANAFQYTSDLAIKLRGVPRIAANIGGNVFAHDDLDDALETKGSVHVSITPNTVDVNTYGQYGVCDFDGDSKDDLFLATGASWWYSSGGKMHWTFLNSHTERLHQVGLGDFNGDGRCDVFAINPSANTWEIVSGGKGAWIQLPGTYDLPISELRFGDFNGDHVSDVFRRAADGQWWAISPGRYGWTALQSSSFPLEALRFGDFNADGVTDVLSGAGGHWSVSWSATSPWATLNAQINEDVASLLIANVDGIAGDDILRYVVTGVISGRWDISSGGQTKWKTFATRKWPNALSILKPAHSVRSWVGRFDAWAGADLLSADDLTRTGQLSKNGQFVPHALYPY